MAFRTHHDRRHDDDAHAHSRTRHDSRSKSHRPDERTYDPRYSYPPPSPQETKGSRKPTRSPARARSKRWPPQPIVEEERIALLKEAGSLRRKSKDDISSRGTIDQDPIIMEASQPATDDRRFVWLASDSDSAKGNPTPPSSDDEKVRRGRRKAPKLETSALPEMMRTASPYAYTKPTVLPHNRSSGEFLLSPESLTPPRTATSQPMRRPPTSAPGQHASAQRQSSFSEQLHASLQNAKTDAVFDDRDLGGSESASKRSERRPARYSFTRQDAPTSSRTSTLPPPPARPVPVNNPRSHLNEDSRRYTDSTTEYPRSSLVDRTVKPAPSKVASLVQEALHTPSGLSQSRSSSGRVSDRGSLSGSPQHTAQYPPSPPHSPRTSLDRARDATTSSKSTPPVRSREDSKDVSPHDSPRIPNSFPTSDFQWTSAFASNAARRTRPGSRLVSSTVQESDVPHANRPPVQLPYPVDDNVFELMPEERDHQYFPDQPALVDPPISAARTLSRAGTPVTTPSTRSRPSLPMRHSLAEGVPLSPAAPASRHTSFTTASRTTAPRAAAVTVQLPPCSRPVYVTGYDDWYTLDDSPGFDICPECVDGVFSGTIYRASFKRSPRRPLSARVKCDFSDAWMRLAWLLTLQRQSPNLNLLKSLANHQLLDDQPCLGKEEAVRNWYTIRDSSGRHLRDFTVCSSDVRKLEILLPALRGVFVPLPIRSSLGYSSQDVKRRCALYTFNNNRFALYLDSLISIHETAAFAHRPLDLSSFVTLVKQKTAIPECSRDDMLISQTWHVMPSLPTFTVCPDCFAELIEPAVRADSDIAMRFNRTPVLMPRETVQGLSCQLYSQRMRRVWKRAVEENDMRYLTRKAKERKEVEDALQEKASHAQRRLDRVRGSRAWATGNREARDEEERLSAEIDEAIEEWQLWE